MLPFGEDCTLHMCPRVSTKLFRSPQCFSAETMGAFTSKSAKVAVDFPGEAKQSDTGPTNSRKRNLLDKGNGRLDSNTEPGKPGDDAIPRDGLSSAPTTGSGANSPMKRTHSAPRFTQPEKRPGDRALAQPPAAKAAARAAKMTKESKPAVAQPRLDGLNEYIIEGPNVTAEQADEYACEFERLVPPANDR